MLFTGLLKIVYWNKLKLLDSLKQLVLGFEAAIMAINKKANEFKRRSFKTSPSDPQHVAFIA